MTGVFYQSKRETEYRKEAESRQCPAAAIAEGGHSKLLLDEISKREHEIDELSHEADRHGPKALLAKAYRAPQLTLDSLGLERANPKITVALVKPGLGACRNQARNSSRSML